ncbi:MAG TPA: ABC transporter permease [Candidatus Saccharimonadia bacterium]|jgi:ABC-2 type transport system permease protein|nr:ABC transporter permease [Candidatus Saccharimonadia bacterium]
MSPRKTLVTAGRVLSQLRHDHRTIALILVVPCVLIWLLKYIFDGQPRVFNMAAPMMLGIFPLIMMFLITSIATLRERKTGTLDRLMTQPIHKLDLMLGYAIAFSLVGLVQASLVSFVALKFLGVNIAGHSLTLILFAVLAAFLGTALGLFVSAFATSEFQAVELIMPIIMPQVLLSGLFVARDQMSSLLEHISDFLPLTYSVDAMTQVTTHSGWTDNLTRDLIVVVGCALAALILGSATIRRQE